MLFFLLASGAIAAPNEIKVFTDELANYGEQTLETHVNRASRAGAGAKVSTTPLQAMPEYSYGIWRNWEFSLQLPLAAEEGLQSGGYRVELQPVAPHNPDRGFYWGANVELANSFSDGEPRNWQVEVIPILGLRSGRWHIVANPGITRSLSGAERMIRFEPAAKIAYRTGTTDYLGLEYYVEAGPLKHWLPAGEQSRMLYLAWDGKVGRSDINIGIGRGTTDASDRWVMKAIYEFSF